jgi:hypothetical protein
MRHSRRPTWNESDKTFGNPYIKNVMENSRVSARFPEEGFATMSFTVAISLWTGAEPPWGLKAAQCAPGKPSPPSEIAGKKLSSSSGKGGLHRQM